MKMMKKLLWGLLCTVVAIGLKTSEISAYSIWLDPASAVSRVSIYVFKTPKDYADMLEGLELAPGVINIITSGGKTAASVGTAVATGGASTAVEGAAEAAKTLSQRAQAGAGRGAVAGATSAAESGGLFDAMNTLGQALAKKGARSEHTIAYHVVGRGNQGAGSEWNWKDLCKDVFKITAASCRDKKIYIVIFDDKTKELLWEGYVSTGAKLLFNVIVPENGSTPFSLMFASSPFDIDVASSMYKLPWFNK